jgi:hypothetical protein
LDKNTSKIDLRNVFETTDKFGKRIVLTSETYNNHILVGHPEMKGNANAMQDTVENPKWIVESKQNPSRWLYIGKSESANYPMVNIKTVVDHSSTDVGYVITGFVQKKVNIEKEGKVIYEED